MSHTACWKEWARLIQMMTNVATGISIKHLSPITQPINILCTGWSLSFYCPSHISGVNLKLVGSCWTPALHHQTIPSNCPFSEAISWSYIYPLSYAFHIYATPRGKVEWRGREWKLSSMVTHCHLLLLHWSRPEFPAWEMIRAIMGGTQPHYLCSLQAGHSIVNHVTTLKVSAPHVATGLIMLSKGNIDFFF